MNDTDTLAPETRLAQEMKFFFREGSHDLKNLFHILHLWTQTTLTSNNQAQAQQHLQEIEAHYLAKMNQLNEAFDTLLTIQAPSPTVVRVSFQHLVDTALLSIQPSLELVGGSIETDFQACPSIAYAPTQLSSAVYALLDNAVRYHAEDRPLRIRVSTAPSTDQIVLVVQDNGTGIDTDRYGKQLFAPFQRYTPRGEGQGINLHLIKVMVEQNGGSITLDSRLGKGTTITLKLRPMEAEV